MEKRYLKSSCLFVLVLMLLSVIFPAGAFAQPEVKTTAATTEESVIGVSYRGHVQNLGNVPTPEGTMIAGPEALGTTGKSLRLEGFWIDLTGDVPVNAGISYQVHVQNVGWQDAVNSGDFAGTKARGLRIEAIKISLVNLPDYDVYYRGHVQNVGNIPQIDGDWGWVKNGEELGTTGRGLRLEELEIKIVRKGIDLTAYNTLLETIEKLDAANYSPESWATLQTALTDNKMTEANSQASIDAATQAIQAAYDALSLKVVAVYDKPGVYGPETGTQTIEGSVIIDVSGVTLQNLVIKGDLTVSEAVGDGDATLNYLTVEGTTILAGGGTGGATLAGQATSGDMTLAGNSGGITIRGDILTKVMVTKNDRGGIRITVINSEYDDFEVINIPEGQPIILGGWFKSVMIQVPDLKLEIDSGTIVESLFAGTADAKKSASGLEISGQGTINNFEVGKFSDDVSVGANIRVTKAQIYGDNSEFLGVVGSANIVGDNAGFRIPPVNSTGNPPVIINPPAPPPGGGGGGGGTVISSDAGLTSVLSQTITAGAQAGTAGAPKLASINVANSVSTLSLAQIVPATNATKALYTNSNFTTGEISGATTTPLSVGANTVYVKVTAQNGSTVLYYAVTITRAVGVPANTASNAAFTDGDTTAGEISGDFTWTAATSETDITGYRVYWLDAMNDKVGTVVATVAKGGTNRHTFVADTPIPDTATKLVVYAYNGNGEETTGSIVTVSDNTIGDVPANAPSNAAFTDGDTTSEEISGDFTWTAATSETDITGYRVYWLDAMNEKVGTVVATVAKGGTNRHTFVADTPIPDTATKLVVYAYNGNGEETTGSIVTVSDNAIGDVPANTASNAAFTDVDTTAEEISGDFTWTAATSETDIIGYRVYWLDAMNEKVGTVVATVAKGGTNSHTFVADTPIPDTATKLVVYAYNGNGEETTGSIVTVSDNAIGDVPTNTASNAAFTDVDTTAEEISGDFTWTAATSETDIIGYRVYWLDAMNEKVGTVVATVAKGGTNSHTFVADTPIPDTATKLVVYAYNGNGEETTGSIVTVIDNN